MLIEYLVLSSLRCNLNFGCEGCHLGNEVSRCHGYDDESQLSLQVLPCAPLLGVVLETNSVVSPVLYKFSFQVFEPEFKATLLP